MHSESAAICGAAAKTAPTFARYGYTEKDTEAATFAAWRDLKRDRYQNRIVEVSVLESYVENFRLLVIMSEPAGATVHIDDLQCETPTKCETWVKRGNHTIVVSMDDYRPYETTKIVDDSRTEVSAKLKRK